MIRYAVTIFLSAFLLFQVQPLIGKFILPWFGGSPAVWTTCMLFFQVVLLAGYSYAHFVTSRLSPWSLAACHGSLLLVSLAVLPIAPADSWKTTEVAMPIARILALLSATIGLPYFLLSTTGPLLQESFRRETGNAPYRLYSLSNIGSLLALLTYPFLFEPELTLHTQIIAWSVGYALFVLLGGWCAVVMARLPAHGHAEDPASAVDAPRPTWRDIAYWLALAACGSVMLLATTNQLCQEISSVPFLWVVPLALYLLSFIICFDHERWYHRGTFLALLTLAVLLAWYTLYHGNQLKLWQQMAAYSATLFVSVMVCHGELVRARPAPHFATLFYLMVAAGGALGGVAVAIVAPLVLRDFWEYHIGLILTVALAFVATLGRGEKHPAVVRAGWIAAGIVSVAIGLSLGIGMGTSGEGHLSEENLETTRNFYGVLRVNRETTVRDDNGPKNELIHGRIQHGFQYLDDDKRSWPTTYYGPPSGIGLAIERHPRRLASEPMRIGVIGLGCGTLAAYGRAGDTVRFYEINPEVIRISDEYFSFRRDSPANVEVVLGDARIELEREQASNDLQRFDVLAVDAFSSDAIPMHLLTRQCIELFRDHMKPDGLMCFHISNRFLDLSGVVAALADAVGVQYVFIDSKYDPAAGLETASWVVLTNNKEFLAEQEIVDAVATTLEADKHDAPRVLWTDDYGSLWRVLEDAIR